MTRFVAALLLLGIAACTDLALPVPHLARLDFDARSTSGEGRPAALTSASSSSPEVQVQGGAKRIVVRGRIRTPNPCQNVSAVLVPLGRDLRLDVTARRTGDGCPDVIGTFTYQAVVDGLPAGRYRVRVRHLCPGTGWETRTVLDHPVWVR
ncbi:MAG TPA: hypothetical protein VGR37_11205 [Longimicrobiaceae bacterium]|nr:hypothetical protein [Longimicrobiaceae bacterium]